MRERELLAEHRGIHVKEKWSPAPHCQQERRCAQQHRDHPSPSTVSAAPCAAEHRRCSAPRDERAERYRDGVRHHRAGLDHLARYPVRYLESHRSRRAEHDRENARRAVRHPQLGERHNHQESSGHPRHQIERREHRSLGKAAAHLQRVRQPLADGIPRTVDPVASVERREDVRGHRQRVRTRHRIEREADHAPR